MRAAAAALLAGVLLPLPGRAATPQVTPAEVEQMVQVFDTLCLRAFPDRGATDKAAAQYGGRALSAREVRSYLHDDPGRGWTVVRPEATYVVTIEEPPWHACGVRRMTPTGFPTTDSFAAAAGRYAAARHRPLGAAVAQSTHTPDGLDISATVQQLAGRSPDGQADALMVLFTDYHGNYAGPLAADAGRPGIEVRFVHQLRAPGLPP